MEIICVKRSLKSLRKMKSAIASGETLRGLKFSNIEIWFLLVSSTIISSNFFLAIYSLFMISFIFTTF